MTATLLKHEWIRTRGPLATTIGIAALLVIVCALAGILRLPFLSNLGQIVGLVVIAATIPAVQLVLAFDFWQSSFGRTGYLTQAFPLRGTRIFWTKLGWHLMVTVAVLPVLAVLALVLVVGLNVASGAPANPFPVIGEIWSAATSVASPALVLGLALAFLVQVCLLSVQYVFAASVGSESSFHRFGRGGPVLVFVGLYLVLQVACFVGLVAIPLGLGVADGRLGLVPMNILELMRSGENGTAMPVGFIPVFAIAAVVLLWRTSTSWKRKISLV